MRISPGIKNEDLPRSVFYMQDRLLKCLKESTTLTNVGKPTLPTPQTKHTRIHKNAWVWTFRFSKIVNKKTTPISSFKGRHPTFSPFPCLLISRRGDSSKVGLEEQECSWQRGGTLWFSGPHISPRFFGWISRICYKVQKENVPIHTHIILEISL